MQLPRTRHLAILSILFLTGALLAACGKHGSQNGRQMPPAQVGVHTLMPQSVPLVRDLVGRLSAYRSADVRARVSGVLLKREYDEGSMVHKGQVLFQIDPAPLKAALDSARAALAQAQANYTNQKIAAARARKLAPRGFVSQSALDNAEAAERTAAAAVQQAEANVEAARINLGYATVRAPIDGRAEQQQVTEGALVGQGSATLLTTVDQINPLYVNFTMPVDELDKLRRSQAMNSATLVPSDHARISLELPDGTTYGDPGTVDFSGSTVNPETGTVQLRGVIPNSGGQLLPGMYVNIKVTFGSLNNAYLVPEAALLRDAKGPFVMLLGKDNKIGMQRVTTDGTYKQQWIITKGLSKGERLIVEGLAKARPGQTGAIIGKAGKSTGKSAGKPKRAGSH